jgi:bifunctional non-homologous end joining protein LigD
LKKKDPNELVFEAGKLLERVERVGDLFEPVIKLKQRLPALSLLQQQQTGTAQRKGLPAQEGSARVATRKSGPARSRARRRA